MKDATRRERFERALLPHLDAAYNLARWLTGSGHEAEDAVQEACLRALEYFEGFRGEDGRAWLLAIVRNTCYDRLRRTRPTEELLDAADSAAGPEALQLQAADRALVHRGMERLPAEYREALVLREMEGLSYREIARVAGVPVGTVMSRLARARAGLRAAIVKERQ